MGPVGTYQLFAIDAAPVGGMMKLAGAARVPFWLYYFNTEAVDAAELRVKANGGELINGPQQVPGGSWIAQCLDPGTGNREGIQQRDLDQVPAPRFAGDVAARLGQVQRVH